MTAERVQEMDQRDASPPRLPEVTGSDEPPVDAAVIDQLASITDSEGFSVLGELLNAFLAAAPARLDALDRAVATRDLAGVADEAHALTGSSASFGARGMAALCRRLRAAAEQGDHDGVRSLLSSLHAEFLRVRAALVGLSRRGT